LNLIEENQISAETIGREDESPSPMITGSRQIAQSTLQVKTMLMVLKSKVAVAGIAQMDLVSLIGS